MKHRNRRPDASGFEQGDLLTVVRNITGPRDEETNKSQRRDEYKPNGLRVFGMSLLDDYRSLIGFACPRGFRQAAPLAMHGAKLHTEEFPYCHQRIKRLSKRIR